MKQDENSMRFSKKFRDPLMFFTVLLVLITIILLYFYYISTSETSSYFIIILAQIIIIGMMSLSIFQVIAQKYLVPRSHAVAIVGFPKSGKTTLLVSIFGEIFAGRILPIKATPRGTKTIERINESLELLRKGRALGPTKDQDRFSFRADVTVRRTFFPRSYKVEFGDFPGEDSQKYSEKYGPWLHTTEFFKWTVDSDAIIFVIDVGHCIAKDESRIDYVAKISSAMQAAWQHFLDYNGPRMEEVRQHPLVLVFTKADLFGVEEHFDNWNLIEEEIAKLGFGDNIPPIKEIDHKAFAQGQDQVRQDFAELIRYFEIEAPNFQVLFTSSFGLLNGKRIGIRDLMMAVLSR